jgi:hypothetical protein
MALSEKPTDRNCSISFLLHKYGVLVSFRAYGMIDFSRLLAESGILLSINGEMNACSAPVLRRPSP